MSRYRNQAEGAYDRLKWYSFEEELSCIHDKAMDSPAGTCLTLIPYRHDEDTLSGCGSGFLAI